MVIGQIEGFVQVARQGHLGRAAEALSISQPALTVRIHELEATLGSSLFRRTRTGMVLTSAGRAFLPHAERAIQSLESGAALVRELEQGIVGELTLGVAPAVGAYVLPDLLARFGRDHPNVRLLVRTGHSEELVDLVVRGEADLGIVRQLRDPRVLSRPLYEDELVLVARPDHAFATTGRVDVSAMRDTQLILFDRTSSYYDLTNALFRSAGVTPRSLIELDNIEAAKRMVERGLGVSLLPGTAVADAIEAGVLAEIALVGVGSIRRRIVAVERLGANVPSPIVGAFASLLDQIPEIIPRAKRIGAPD